MSELDQIDPQTLTRSQAASLFQSKVAERQGNTGEDIIKAWANTRILNPKLFARMCVHDEAPNVADVQPAGRHADSSGIIKGPMQPLPYTGSRTGQAPSLASKLLPRGAVSIPNEGNIEALGLPRDCSFEEFQAADRANAGASPRNARAIFDALVKLQAGKGLSPEAAQGAARDRYPQLFSELKDTAATTR